MTLKLMRVSAAVALAMVPGLTHANPWEEGTLNMVPHAGNFDFHYMRRNTFDKQKERHVRAKIKYEGQGDIERPQHFVVAQVHRNTADHLRNADGEFIWSHGAGVIVSERGLGLELWFIDSMGRHNALVWDQEDRCARDVLGTLEQGQMCVGAEPQVGANWVSSRPSFKLERGVVYEVNIRYSPESDKVTSMHAVLSKYSPGSTDPTVLQDARLFYRHDVFTPLDDNLQTVIARTPGLEPDRKIEYKVNAREL